MKRAVIFAGAPVDAAAQPPVPSAQLYLCADAGARLAQALGIKPDWIIGDFDSLGETPTGLRVAVFTSEKDDTDTILAAKYALLQECDELVFYGALGGRLDHTIANLQMLRMLADHQAHGILLDEKHFITLLRSETSVYPKRSGYLSLFSLTEVCEDVTVQGVKYPLSHGTLSGSFPLGVSNQVLAQQAVVTVGKGDLLVVFATE